MNSKKENLWSKVSTFLVFAGPATFSFLAVVIVPFPGTDTAVCGSFRNTGKRDRIFTGTAGNRKN